MRMVVDSNFLQSEKLRAYLSKSAKNWAVLTDYAAMEAYKGDTLASIYQSMEILAECPKQIIVLKGTQTVCGLRGRRSGLQRRLIDEDQTRGFAEYCRHLCAAQRGNVSLQHQLLELGREATAHMARMRADAMSMPAVFDEIAKTYTEAELRVLRKRSGYTEPLVDKLVKNILGLAGLMFARHPRVNKLPDAKELPNAFIFRAALCAYLLALRWISVGGARNVKPEKMRNDLVDVNFAVFATYFDGLLTADNKLSEIYLEAICWLQTIFSMKAT